MHELEALQATMEEVKANLKMAFVLEQRGYLPEIVNDGKMHYRSPFRDDEHPSFDVFMLSVAGRVAEERFDDFADPNLNQGDVLDLISLFNTSDVGQAITEARELLALQISSGWAGPTAVTTAYKVLDFDEIKDLVDRQRPLQTSDLWFNLTRSHPGLSEVVLPSSRVFLHPDLDVVVFLLLDNDGEPRGVRFRKADGHKYTLKGTKNILMRLEEPSDKPVLLCEGETDTWAAWGALHDTYEVMGIPGVNTTPAKAGADTLRGRKVYIAFDPDEAGIQGRTVWANYLDSLGCTVMHIIVPESKDLAGLHSSVIRKLPERARAATAAPEGMVRHDGVFASVTMRRDEAQYSSQTNWSFTPEKLLEGESGSRAYMGTLEPSGRQVILPDAALSSSAKLKSWGAPYQARWSGSDAQVQKLAMLIDHESTFLPAGKVTDQIGLYEGTFVWPGNYIGDVPVEFVPGVAETLIGPSHVFIRREPVNRVAVFNALYEAQHPAVTSPILAWMAPAPIHTLFYEFPVLNISGASGSGKSALTKEMLRVFTSTNIANTLTSSTPYAVAAMVDSSSGFPIWFDEYRPGAKVTAKNQLDQLLRDAYTMQPSSKGGQDLSNLSKLTHIRTAAPLIVSGEDSFTETSHTDRMVMVRLRQSEQGNLGVLQNLNTTGFGHEYLSSLTKSPNNPDDAAVFEKPQLSTYGQGLRERQAANARVLMYGWGLLENFLGYHNLPTLDLSRILAEGEEAGKSNPIMELVLELLETDTREPIVWRDEDDSLCIRPEQFIKESTNYPAIVLPVSSAKGLISLLVDQHGGEAGQRALTPTSPYAPSKRVRVVRLPASVLD